MVRREPPIARIGDHVYNAGMRGPLNRLLSVATVWLTACATAFASSPHFECVRPDGSRSPFCLSWIVGPVACCTNPVSTGAKTTSSCCSHCKAVKVATNVASTIPLKNSSGHAGISKPICEKAIVHSVAIFDHGEQSIDLGISPFWAPPADAQPIPTAAADTDSVPASFSSPPEDIVVLHQHFLI